jgi:DNA-binding NarL/FixJ family response regulator
MPSGGRERGVNLDPDDSAAGKPGPKESQNPRVLITGDRPEFVALITHTLRGFDCEFVADVEHARMVLSVGAVDLLLCDIKARGEAAMVLADEIVESALDTAVILLTDEDDPDFASSAFEFGAYGYLVNPPLPGHLLMTIKNALRRRELELAQREHARNLEDRGQAIIDRAPMPIYAKDPAGRYILSNATADQMAGVAPGAMIGQTDEAIMPPEFAATSAGSDRGVLADGSIYEAKEVLVVDGVPRTSRRSSSRYVTRTTRSTRSAASRPTSPGSSRPPVCAMSSSPRRRRRSKT